MTTLRVYEGQKFTELPGIIEAKTVMVFHHYGCTTDAKESHAGVKGVLSTAILLIWFSNSLILALPLRVRVRQAEACLAEFSWQSFVWQSTLKLPEGRK